MLDNVYLHFMNIKSTSNSMHLHLLCPPQYLPPILIDIKIAIINHCINIVNIVNAVIALDTLCYIMFIYIFEYKIYQ